jgi:hypothetical protein
MTKFASILFLQIMIISNCLAQPKYVTDDSAHIFWQPNVKLTFNDFRGDSTGKYKESYKQVGLQVMAYVGLWSILDVPSKKKERGKKLEKVYIAPAFDKINSYFITKDTTQLKIQQVYFDIAETWARWARQQLNMYQDSMKGYGTLYIMYSTVIKDAKSKQQKMNDAYTKEVIIQKEGGAYDRWRKLIDDELNKTSSWMTSPKDCFRFISNKPIESGYEQSPTVAGAIPDKTK